MPCTQHKGRSRAVCTWTRCSVLNTRAASCVISARRVCQCAACHTTALIQATVSAFWPREHEAGHTRMHPATFSCSTSSSNTMTQHSIALINSLRMPYAAKTAHTAEQRLLCIRADSQTMVNAHTPKVTQGHIHAHAHAHRLRASAVCVQF